MEDNPFENVSIKTDAAAVATARGFCTACLEDRVLSVTQYSNAIGLLCPVCRAQKTYALSALRPAS